MAPCRQDQQFTDEDFGPEFIADMNRAERYVLIHVPYLSSARLRKLGPYIEGIVKRKIRVCINFQIPRNWANRANDPELLAFEQLCKLLISWGVHVTMREELHEKIAVIDDIIVWHGSLNVMSHNRTTEHMERSTDYVKLRQISGLHAIFDCSMCPESVRRHFLPRTLKTAALEIGLECAQRRKELGFTQKDLAAISGVAQSLISKLERGTLDFKLSTMYRICYVLGTDMIWVPRYLGPVVDDMKHAAVTSAVKRISAPTSNFAAQQIMKPKVEPLG